MISDSLLIPCGVPQYTNQLSNQILDVNVMTKALYADDL